jgi:hypothetical protein
LFLTRSREEGKPPFERGWPPKADGGLFLTRRREEEEQTLSRLRGRAKGFSGLLRYARNDAGFFALFVFFAVNFFALRKFNNAPLISCKIFGDF